MRNKLYLTILLIALLAFIIISGCGGDNNGINSLSSIITPTPANSISEDTVGYITIKIVWPQVGKSGRCIISSKGDEKNLTASMTEDTNCITVKVRNKNNEDPNSYFPVGGYYVFVKRSGEDSITKTLGPLPAIDVIIRAEAEHNDPYTGNNYFINASEEDFRIKPGTEGNNVALHLGDYDLTLTADPNTIVLGGSSVSGSNLISNVAALPTPTPGRTVVKNNLTPMNPCMAEITPEGSPLPTDTPTPTPTPIRVYADITATLMIKYPTPTVNPTANTDTTTPPTPTPKFVANKRITFTLIQGNDEGTTLSLDGTTDPNTVSGTTNNNGTSTAKLSTSTAGDKVIKASFQADLNDPNSIYTKYTTISVAVTTPTPTPTRVGTAIVVPNLSGNWKHTGVGARYTINQHGTDLCYLTFTRIDAGTPTPSPEPTNTPASYPTSTPRWNSYWEGTWNGILTSSYNNSMCVSMYPNNTEHVTGYISNNNNTIDWYGTDSKIHYSRWVRE